MATIPVGAVKAAAMLLMLHGAGCQAANARARLHSLRRTSLFRSNLGLGSLKSRRPVGGALGFFPSVTSTASSKARRSVMTLVVPQRLFVKGQLTHGDRHLYASRTRFIPEKLLGLFEQTAWPLAPARSAARTARRDSRWISAPACGECGDRSDIPTRGRMSDDVGSVFLRRALTAMSSNLGTARADTSVSGDCRAQSDTQRRSVIIFG
jgi:hypothetical protein